MTAAGTTAEGDAAAAADTGASRTYSNDVNSSPFRVLGIALVLDQLGKEARLAFRYPTSFNSGTERTTEDPQHHHHQSSSSSKNKGASEGDLGVGKSSNEDLFFTLSSRQMAKLFRPKHALCGQPMTLSVGGTVFCFRAVLMGDPPESQNESSGTAAAGTAAAAGASSSASIASANTQSTSNSNNNHANNNNNDDSDHLVLFSVIVALAPQVDISSIPISGWYEGNDDNQADLLNQSVHQLYSSASMGGGSSVDGIGGSSHHSSHVPISQERHRASASFLAIRRVQVSLARLCRVLEREEKRCKYISNQSKHFFRIRAELQKKWEEKAASASGVVGVQSSKPPASGNSPKADFATKGPSAAERKKAAGHRRGNSFSQGLLLGGTSVAADVTKDRISARGKDNTSNSNNAEYLEEDKEQEILEHVLALGVQDYGGSVAERQHGNLGRELVQVFHAISRNDHNFPKSASVLSGRDGVVYINRHIAVAMEAASLPKTLSSPEKVTNVIVRPYHTLIFPNASPSQLLQALQSTGFTVPLQQLLLMVRPSKPLMDIAVDASLPLSVTMELANYMVGHGACVASTVLNRASRLACKRVDRIQELALDFSQAFDDWSVSLFLIVSFLTTNGRTLGESMKALTTGDDVVGATLRSGILASIFHEDDTENYIFVEDNEDSTSGVNGPGYESPGTSEDKQQLLHPRAEELEEVLYSMAIWLLSHQVLGHIQDYLVLPGNVSAMYGSGAQGSQLNPPPNVAGASEMGGHDNRTTTGGGKPYRSDPTMPSGTETSTTVDDTLLRELHESDCLNGNASIVAISWRLGLDEVKLQSWAIRHDKLRVVSRLAAVGDDWGAV